MSIQKYCGLFWPSAELALWTKSGPSSCGKRIVGNVGSMYAADTHVTITSNDLENLLENAQRELLSISQWMSINKLTANAKKSGYMLIGHPRRVNKIDVSEPLILN